MASRFLLVANPHAGRGRADRDPRALAALLEGRGHPTRLVLTEHPGHAPDLVRAHGDETDVVVAVGGDGTLHEVLQGLDPSRHALAVVPWGTGNDFAWLHDWPTDPTAIVDRLSRGLRKRIDLGLWNAEMADGRTESGRFHNSVGLGFEAVVNYESHRITAIKGPLLYVVALVRTLRHFRCYPARVTWEEGALDDAMAMVSFLNGRRVGGAFLLAPHADPADGLLDLMTAERLRWWQMLALLPRTLKGSHTESTRVDSARAAAFTVEAPQGIPGYVDGEFIDMEIRRLTVRLDPTGLQTIAAP